MSSKICIFLVCIMHLKMKSQTVLTGRWRYDILYKFVYAGIVNLFEKKEELHAMETIQKYVDKVKKDPELIRYIIIGVCTTLVNYVVYFCFTRVITLHSMLANGIAWTVAVLFAYVANKLYVFRSQTNSFAELIVEFFNFVLMRVLSFGAEEALLWIFVVKLGVWDLGVKLVAQVIVIVLNYIFSKLFIFKGAKQKKE